MAKLPRLLPRRTKQNTSPNPSQLADGHNKRMGIFEHLEELRQRFIKAFIALVIGAFGAFFITEPLLDYLREPYCKAAELEQQCELVILGPTGGIVSFFRVSLTLGAILAIPVITYQIMMFIVPGLTRKERRIIFLSLPAVTILFVIGVLFAWFILMPPALGFLEGFQPNLFKPEWTAELYLNFVTTLTLWMGVAFETPLIFFVLALMGIVNSGALIRNWRFAIVGTAIAAALITPTVDPVNMFLVMGPLLVLYVISIFLVIIGRRIGGHNR